MIIMNKIHKILAVVALLFAFTPVYADENDEVMLLDELSAPQLLNSVKVGDVAEKVRNLQHKEAIKLLNGKYNKGSGCTVETIRNKEVLIVTIPADKLFLPNDTVLAPSAAEYLAPLKRYMSEPDLYRVILQMHTDDTGSEKYTDALSISRVDAVFDWFDNEQIDTRYVFPFGSGSSDPLPNTPNISMTNRAKNRRLEVYLVPGQKMVDLLRKGKR